MIREPGDVDPEFEAKLARHTEMVEQLCTRASRAILFTVAVGGGGLALLGWTTESPWMLIGMPFAFAAMWPVHDRVLKRWYRETVGPDVDTRLLEELLIEQKMLSPRGSFLGRRSAAEWDAFTASVRSRSIAP